MLKLVSVHSLSSGRRKSLNFTFITINNCVLLQTALMKACQYGHWEVVQTLMLFKANVSCFSFSLLPWCLFFCFFVPWWSHNNSQVVFGNCMIDSQNRLSQWWNSSPLSCSEWAHSLRPSSPYRLCSKHTWILEYDEGKINPWILYSWLWQEVRFYPYGHSLNLY